MKSVAYFKLIEISGTEMDITRTDEFINMPLSTFQIGS